MNTELRLSLKRQWFELTKSGVKTEDYREINEYWCARLFDFCPLWLHPENNNKSARLFDFCQMLSGETKYVYPFKLHKIAGFHGFSKKIISKNIMTLGYPSKDDTSRIIKLEHKGIEIRTGNPEWGAEPNKLYFVIKHGNII
jgi:hypothetical protein